MGQPRWHRAGREAPALFGKTSCQSFTRDREVHALPLTTLRLAIDAVDVVVQVISVELAGAIIIESSWTASSIGPFTRSRWSECG